MLFVSTAPTNFPALASSIADKLVSFGSSHKDKLNMVIQTSGRIPAYLLLTRIILL